MKRTLKKTLAVFLTLVMLVGFIPFSEPLVEKASFAVKAEGVTLAIFNSKLEQFKSERYSNGSTYVDNPSATGGYQCFGFANELAKYIFGSFPTNSMAATNVNSGWTVTYGGNAIDNLCVGDIVRYLYHSIFITKIDGDNIYYCQANVPSGTNRVTYDNYTTRSELKTKVSKQLTSGNTNKTGWVAHFKASEITNGSFLEVGTITASSNYTFPGNSITFNYSAIGALKYEMVITNITTGERIMYTMTDAQTFTQEFYSIGVHSIEINAYSATEIKGFETYYIEVHNGEQPNTYIGGKKDNLLFPAQELTILHDAPMQEMIKEAILTIYKDGTKFYEGSIISTGIYSRNYKPGIYEGNILLTYKSGYGIYTKTIRWEIYDSSPAVPTISIPKSQYYIGEVLTINLTPSKYSTHEYMQVINRTTGEYAFDGSVVGVDTLDIFLETSGEYSIYYQTGNYFGGSPISSVAFEVWPAAHPEIPTISIPKSQYYIGEILTINLTPSKYSTHEYMQVINRTTGEYAFDGSVLGCSVLDIYLENAGEYSIYYQTGNYFGSSPISSVDFSVNLKLTSISINSLPKTSYYGGDTLDLSGLTINALYSNGTSEVITNGFSCSVKNGEKLNKTGKQTITVTYKDKTTSFEIEVRDIPELKLKASSSYTKKDEFVTGVSCDVTANNIISSFENEDIKIIDQDENIISASEQVGTGCKVQLLMNGEVVDSLTIIISGDVDGNGNVDSTDYLKIKSAFLGTLDLNEIYFKAADVDYSLKIDTTDYLRIKSHFLGTYNLYN